MVLQDVAILGWSQLVQVIKEKWEVVAFGGMVCALLIRKIAKAKANAKVQRKVRDRGERSRKSLEKLREQLKLEKVDLSITELSFRELRDSLQKGTLKAVDVYNAYMAKALEVNDYTNAITDYVEVGRAEAEALDRLPASERGMLHGIPISVKETCGLKGVDCTAGIAKVIDNPMPRDSVTIKILKSHGAVPFIKTNIPQALRHIGCDNPIFGASRHPMDQTRSPGGSSGGEGAIIGGGASILGIGSDLGGSIRMPSSVNGIFGFKPTAERISAVGNFGRGLKMGGQKIFLGCDGPMARDTYTLVECMRASLSPSLFEFDAYVPPIPFREEIFQDRRPLKIGYYLEDGTTRCTPAVLRAVELATDALRSLGHTVVESPAPDGDYLNREILWPACFGDNFESYSDLIDHEDSNNPIRQLYNAQTRPYFLRRLQAKWRILTTNDEEGAMILARKPLRKTRDYWDLVLDKQAFFANVTKKWKEQNLDVVICPPFACSAVTLGHHGDLLSLVGKASIYNVLNFTAGSVPVTHVTAEDVVKTQDPKYYFAKTRTEKTIKKDAINSEGLPVGVQIIGLPYQEEMVLRVMTELEQALQPSTN